VGGETHVVSLATFWGSQDLGDHAESGETVVDILHSGILVGTGKAQLVSHDIISASGRQMGH